MWALWAARRGDIAAAAAGLLRLRPELIAVIPTLCFVSALPASFQVNRH
jgi:hypothetical protein